MSDDDEEATLFVHISLPAEEKEKLRIACRRKGLYMREYVEGLVRTALGLEPRTPLRKANGSNGSGGSSDA